MRVINVIDVTCNRCLKQYVSQTVDEFRHKWSNYKDDARKFEREEHCMQTQFYEHFNLPGHSGFLNDVSVTLLIRQTLRILINENITGFTPLKPKHHWD